MPRVVPLAGAVNFRDFGGYETVAGARIREGVLFRSGMMAEITAGGQIEFAKLGIGVVCDLRRADERAAEPTPFPAHDPQQVHIPIDPDSAVRLREALRQPEPVAVPARVAFMVEMNRELARNHVRDYRCVFDAALAASGRGFLIHCAAGKDRTGFGVALIQFALGMSREAVMHDYLLTNTAVDFEHVALPRLMEKYPEREIDFEGARALSGVRAEYLGAALDTVEDSFGGMDRYLNNAIGLDADKRRRLEQAFLI